MHYLIHSQPSGFAGLEPQEMRSHDGHAYRIIMANISFHGISQQKEEEQTV
jgi:hypothetical protein